MEFWACVGANDVSSFLLATLLATFPVIRSRMRSIPTSFAATAAQNAHAHAPTNMIPNARTTARTPPGAHVLRERSCENAHGRTRAHTCANKTACTGVPGRTRAQTHEKTDARQFPRTQTEHAYQAH